jgi:hypothetical protein
MISLHTKWVIERTMSGSCDIKEITDINFFFCSKSVLLCFKRNDEMKWMDFCNLLCLNISKLPHKSRDAVQLYILLVEKKVSPPFILCIPSVILSMLALLSIFSIRTAVCHRPHKYRRSSIHSQPSRTCMCRRSFSMVVMVKLHSLYIHTQMPRAHVAARYVSEWACERVKRIKICKRFFFEGEELNLISVCWALLWETEVHFLSSQSHNHELFDSQKVKIIFFLFAFV